MQPLIGDGELKAQPTEVIAVAHTFSRNVRAFLELCLRWSRTAIYILVAGMKRFIEVRGLDHAASISFFALLSFAPLAILVASAAGYLAVMAGPETSENVVAEIAEALQDLLPVQTDQIRQVVMTLIANRGKFGIVGAIVMLLSATMVFGAIEHAMGHIFDIQGRRRFIASRMLFSVLIVAIGCVLFVIHYALTLADSIMLATRGVTLDVFLRESAFVDMVLTYLPVPVGFIVAVYIFGPARVPFRHLVVGAVIFFTLWEAAREGYGWYVERVARFGLLYGSLATPIILILWTFYSATVFLFSSCCVAVLSRVKDAPR